MSPRDKAVMWRARREARIEDAIKSGFQPIFWNQEKREWEPRAVSEIPSLVDCVFAVGCVRCGRRFWMRQPAWQWKHRRKHEAEDREAARLAEDAESDMEFTADAMGGAR